MNHVCIISGPASARALITQALGREDLTVTEATDHGLPSYTDPITAHAAGAPNSGHQIDGLHPETLDYVADDGSLQTRENPLTDYHGQAYEDDPAIGFLRVECDDPDRVAALVADRDWQLRAHGTVLTPPEPTVEEHLAAIDAHLEQIRGLRS